MNTPKGLTKAQFKTWYGTTYLQSDHWKQVRARAVQLAENRCAGCRESKTLNVHHIVYHLGKEKDSELIVLCEKCHRLTHAPWRRSPQDFTVAEIRACLMHFFAYTCGYEDTRSKNALRRIRRSYNKLPMALRLALKRAKATLLSMATANH